MPSSRGSSQPRDQTQVSRCRQILYHLNHQGSPRILEGVAYPFSRGSSQSRNRTRVSCKSPRKWKTITMGKETGPLKGEPACLVVPGEMKVKKRRSEKKEEHRKGRQLCYRSLRIAFHCTAHSGKPTLIWTSGLETVNCSPSLALCTVWTVFARAMQRLFTVMVSLFPFQTTNSWILGNNLAHLFLKVRTVSPPLKNPCFHTQAKKKDLKSYQKTCVCVQVCLCACGCTCVHIQKAISYKGARTGLPKTSGAMSSKS